MFNIFRGVVKNSQTNRPIQRCMFRVILLEKYKTDFELNSSILYIHSSVNKLKNFYTSCIIHRHTTRPTDPPPFLNVRPVFCFLNSSFFLFHSSGINTINLISPVNIVLFLNAVCVIYVTRIIFLCSYHWQVYISWGHSTMAILRSQISLNSAN